MRTCPFCSRSHPAQELCEPMIDRLTTVTERAAAFQDALIRITYPADRTRCMRHWQKTCGCSVCLAAAVLFSQGVRYQIGQRADGQRYITCFQCTLTSHSQGDVENRYCVKCNVFHEDEARRDRLRRMIRRKTGV